MRTAPTKHMVAEFKKPDRLEDPTAFVADDFEDDDIQPVVKQLAPICDDFREHSFAWQYKLGKVVRDCFDDLQEQRRSMYGARFFHRLARELKRPNVSGQLLANCYRLVKQYTEPEYLRYVQQPEVSPTHLLLLAGIEDHDLRNELIQKVIDENLTTQQLQIAMKKKFGLQRKGQPGRPLLIPKNVQAGVIHLDTQAEKYVKLNNDCWFGERFNLADEIKRLPADKLTDEFKGQLSGVLEKCVSLSAVVHREISVLREVLAEVERRMQAQAEVNARVAAEEKELEEQERVELAAKDTSHSRDSRPRQSTHDQRIGRELHAV